MTPASGFVSAQAAFVIELTVGLSSYSTGKFLKSKLKLDDALDVTALQAVPGIISTIFGMMHNIGHSMES